jgi:hypothetical protein
MCPPWLRAHTQVRPYKNLFIIKRSILHDGKRLSGLAYIQIDRKTHFPTT